MASTTKNPVYGTGGGANEAREEGGGGRKIEAIGIVLMFLVMVASNAISSGTKLMGDTNAGELSGENPTYLTPDGSTFSIWGLIYLFEALFVLYQAAPAGSTKGWGGLEDARVGKARRWVLLAFALNACWLPVFQYRRWWLALAVIVGYLYALWRTRQALETDFAANLVGACAPQSWGFRINACTGFSLNLSWLVVATLLNVTVVARNSRIIYTVVTEGVTNATAGVVHGSSGAAPVAIIGGNVDWAVFCIALAVGLALSAAYYHADLPYVFIACWALGGVYRMQHTADDARFPASARSDDLMHWAVAGMIIASVGGLLAIAAGIVMRRGRKGGSLAAGSDRLDAPLTPGGSGSGV
mmetsp:Transcript_83144/g.231343  ORF Transcript_83144/g.231343 Transcript_83144/m.231343 type:complete len:356 (-) Transcript_83144:161-1228(-)